MEAIVYFFSKLSNSHSWCNNCVSNGLKINNLIQMFAFLAFIWCNSIIFMFDKIMQWNSARPYHHQVGIISIKSILARFGNIKHERWCLITFKFIRRQFVYIGLL